MTDQPDPLSVHEREVRAYAAGSGDVVLRRHLTAVLAEYDAIRPVVEAAVKYVAVYTGPVSLSRDAEKARAMMELIRAVNAAQERDGVRMKRHRWKIRTAPAATGWRPNGRPIAGIATTHYSGRCSCGFTSEWLAVKEIVEGVMKDHVNG